MPPLGSICRDDPTPFNFYELDFLCGLTSGRLLFLFAGEPAERRGIRRLWVP